ncbi:MAG TPA: hypothetical protein VHP14_17470 [Anaerolineales bacterium]|nr:hypothetical protein [Anaerolineales bacterium]
MRGQEFGDPARHRHRLFFERFAHALTPPVNGGTDIGSRLIAEPTATGIGYLL